MRVVLFTHYAALYGANRSLLALIDGLRPYGCELIEHEHTGRLYRNGPEELAACMERPIANPARARSLGENGWQTAREGHTIEAYATQVHEVLRSLLPRRRVAQRAEACAT